MRKVILMPSREFLVKEAGEGQGQVCRAIRGGTACLGLLICKAGMLTAAVRTPGGRVLAAP